MCLWQRLDCVLLSLMLRCLNYWRGNWVSGVEEIKVLMTDLRPSLPLRLYSALKEHHVQTSGLGLVVWSLWPVCPWSNSIKESSLVSPASCCTNSVHTEWYLLTSVYRIHQHRVDTLEDLLVFKNCAFILTCWLHKELCKYSRTGWTLPRHRLQTLFLLFLTFYPLSPFCSVCL